MARAAAANRRRHRRPTSPAISATTAATSRPRSPSASVIVEREYRTPWVHQSYLEPQVCAATVDPLGNVVVYACTQAMFRTRDTVAAGPRASCRPRSRCIAMPVGGGFGGKFGLIEPLVAACAVAAGRPVRLAFTRLEEFGGRLPGAVVDLPRQGRRARRRHVRRAQGRRDLRRWRPAWRARRRTRRCVWRSSTAGRTWRSTRPRWSRTRRRRARIARPACRRPCSPRRAWWTSWPRSWAWTRSSLRQKNAIREGDIRPDGTPWPQVGLAEVPGARRAGVPRPSWPRLAGRRRRHRARRLVRRHRAVVGAVPTRVGRHAADRHRRGRSDRHQFRLSDRSPPRRSGSTAATGARDDGRYRRRAVLGRDRRQQDHLHHGPSGHERRPGGPRAGAARSPRPSSRPAVEDLEMVDGEVRVKGVPGKAKTLKEIYKLSASFGARHEPVVGKGEAAITQRSPGSGVHVARVRVDPRDRPRRAAALRDRAGRRARHQSGAGRGADPRRRRAGRRLGHVRGDRARRVGHADHGQPDGLHDSQGEPDPGARGDAGRGAVHDRPVRRQAGRRAADHPGRRGRSPTPSTPPSARASPSCR